MKLISVLITVCLFAMSSNLDNKVNNFNDCSAQLIVEKDRSFKSADEDGAQFILVLTNTSRDTKTFYLSARNLTAPCNNNNTQYHRRAASGNSNLNVSFQGYDLSRNRINTTPSNEVQLRSGESYKFIVNATVPNGTPFNTWSCIEVEAKSEDCGSKSETTILSVYVPDPSEG
ncbi:hypothetical protein [uncultured Psychroserpens sp.]|uniref:hypothetical protein n=1 Tax=uncultured Psychroserpens sp. TaxID=255436 RepID=UPI0026116F6E|nr:hypothetical protein [uncultured Psychroserpens sp.]